MTKTKSIYETPLIQALCVSTESGFADSLTGTADTEELNEKVYQW